LVDVDPLAVHVQHVAVGVHLVPHGGHMAVDLDPPLGDDLLGGAAGAQPLLAHDLLYAFQCHDRFSFCVRLPALGRAARHALGGKAGRLCPGPLPPVVLVCVGPPRPGAYACSGPDAPSCGWGPAAFLSGIRAISRSTSAGSMVSARSMPFDGSGGWMVRTSPSLLTRHATGRLLRPAPDPPPNRSFWEPFLLSKAGAAVPMPTEKRDPGMVGVPSSVLMGLPMMVLESAIWRTLSIVTFISP